MGIDVYIGEEQVRLTNAFYYNAFLNWVAEQGDFPHILNHSPIHGSYTLDPDRPPTMYDGSVFALKKEAKTLLDHAPPDYAEHVLRQILKGCELAVDMQQKITMDDGAWEGE